MTSDPQRVQAIFLAAAEKSEADRLAHLERECNGDQDLRRRVIALLKAHDEPWSLLDSPPPELESLEDRTVCEAPGDTIGAYKLIGQIGEGGFGVVFLAEQERPVRRKVALKIIKPGMDTREVIARFEAERQALAMMDHSNIAKVFDAGETASGRPFFVMELVEGVPITQYCDQCNLPTRERLELFIAVCRAVQHAHQKGVIHRDIKPTNVLVAMQDGRPVPKIIDFGVAKALHQRLTEHTNVTTFAQMIGTPLYMSPEQAELSVLGVDTRSDIYSLGVLLYELLTGTTPFDSSRFRDVSYDELRRILREEEPPRPSTRLSTLAADRATTIAEHFRTDSRRHIEAVRGELDWIVMKCLEKDRNRRYETVTGLARDVERYLNDEPVTACPPSAVYRFRKFARRYKAALIAASAGLLVLLVLVAGLAVSNRLISAERVRADEERSLAQQLAHEEQQASDFAQAEAAKATAVVTLLQDMLSAAHPDSAGSKDYTVRQLLDQFSAGLENRLADQPEVEATLRQIIGSVYTRLRLMDEAEPHLRRSLELSERTFGKDHVKYADGLRHLAWNALEKDRASQEVEQLARQALAIFRKHADAANALESQWLLVLSLDGQGKPAEAEAAANDALEFARTHKREDHPVVANLLHQLAWIHIRERDYVTAERLARESVAKHLVAHGESHPETAFGWTYLAAALSWQGKFAEAEDSLRKSLAAFRKSFAEDHRFLDRTRNDLVLVLQAQGKHDEVVRELRESIRIQPDNADAMNTLAWLLCTTPNEQHRDATGAVELAAKAVELAPQNGLYWNTLGVAQYRAGNWQKSVDALNNSTKFRDGGDAMDWFFLAMAEWQLGNHDAARDWFRKAIDWMNRQPSTSEELERIRAEAESLKGLSEPNDAPADDAERNTVKTED